MITVEAEHPEQTSSETQKDIRMIDIMDIYVSADKRCLVPLLCNFDALNLMR
jgi:hypothetical protein